MSPSLCHDRTNSPQRWRTLPGWRWRDAEDDQCKDTVHGCDDGRYDHGRGCGVADIGVSMKPNETHYSPFKPTKRPHVPPGCGGCLYLFHFALAR